MITNELISEIKSKINDNHKQDITGGTLQGVLVDMVKSLCEVYPQTYTDEEKAQARANIDALSNHNGEITKEKLSAEVQAILDDVANKQNITDESLATIAKTIVEAINEVYNGGLKDASIATSKIEDGAITEPKLDTALTAKVNNNVKTVAQTLSDDEINIASKNLKFRDTNGNFFADKASYDAVAKLDASEKPNYSIFGNKCINNTFGHSCENYTFGNDCQSNTFGDGCKVFTFGNDCHNNTFGDSCLYFTIGNCCYGNTFGDNLTNFQIDTGVSFIIVNSNSSYSSRLQNVHILSGVSGKSFKKLTINIPDEYLNSSRELIITTKVTSGNRPLTPEDIVMYYADEVVDKQNKQDNTLATTSKEVVGAINELFNGGVKDASIGVGKLAQAVQDTLKMVGTNVKEVKTGEDLFSLEDGIYSLNGSTYTNYPIGIPFDSSSVCILVVTHSNQRATLYGVDGSHSSPILPLVAIGDLTNKRWTGGSFYSFFASDYEVGHKLDQKLDNTSTLTDTEVNNIWDNN